MYRTLTVAMAYLQKDGAPTLPGHLPGNRPRARSCLRLLVADVGQDRAQVGGQRVPGGQDAVKPVDRVAQQRPGVAVATQLVVRAGKLRAAAQRIGVTGTERPLEAGLGLLVYPFGRH